MNFLKTMSSMFGGKGSNVDYMDDRYWTDNSLVVHDGHVAVTPDNVIGIPVAFACLKILSESIGTLPMVLYEKKKDGSRVKLEHHALHDLFNKQPNSYQDAIEFRKAITWDACLRGNGYAEISGARSNAVGTLDRIHPDMVEVKESSTEGFVYDVTYPNGSMRTISRENMFHLRLGPLTSSNVVADSVIDYGKIAFAKSLMLSEYSSRFFKNDATPGGIVTLKDRVTNPEHAIEFRKKWQGQFTGSNRHKVAFLDMAAEYNPISIPNDKAQFIDTVKENNLDILRLFRMPPHKVQNLDRSTFSNIEEQSLSFVTDTLLPIIVGWEKAIKRQLSLSENQHLVHNVSGLLRGDLESRYKSYAIGRTWGWLSVNDVRKLEDMPPIDDGDQYLQPLNMAPVGMAISERLGAELQRYRLNTIDGKCIEGKSA